MFSSSALVQIVFAEQNDNYFLESIFKTDLNHYMWYELHDKYNTVYFVDGEIKGDIRISHYQEKYVDNFKSRGFFKDTISKWLRRQLKETRNKSAVVFSLESFCNIFENEETFLREIKKDKDNGNIHGTIVLTVSPNVRKSLQLLLTSSVFEYLDEQPVLFLRQYDDNIYTCLKSRKQDACVFLNVYTRECITNIIHYIILEDGSRFSGYSDLDSIIDYLTQYINNKYMQMTTKRLFKNDFVLINPSYRSLYAQLKDKNVWNELVSRSVEYKGRLKENLPNNYIDENTIRFCPSYDDETIEMRCMKLCFAGAIYDSAYDEQTIVNLNDIYQKISYHKNREKNHKLEEKLNELIDELQKAQSNKDNGTCGRVVSAILFCTKWLYEGSDDQEQVMKWVDFFKASIQISSCYYEITKDFNSSAYQQESTKQKIEKYAMQLDVIDKLISIRNINMELNNIPDISENMKNIMCSVELSSKNTEISHSTKQRQENFHISNQIPDGLFDPSIPD